MAEFGKGVPPAEQKRIDVLEDSRKKEFNKTADEASKGAEAASLKKAEMMKAAKYGNEEIDKLEAECAKILSENGGLEGNIPVHDVYWGMRNQIRVLLSKM